MRSAPRPAGGCAVPPPLPGARLGAGLRALILRDMVLESSAAAPASHGRNVLPEH